MIEKFGLASISTESIRWFGIVIKALILQIIMVLIPLQCRACVAEEWE